jgi:ribA/ribD-fused uncharacterized protein
MADLFDPSVEPILSFSGPWRPLSNFWFVPVRLDGLKYRSVEHAYQAAKTPDLFWRRHIQKASTPGGAKNLGSRVPLRPDWDDIRVPTMDRLLRQKFDVPELGRLLLSTGLAELVEGNTWGDTFWGECRGEGQNKLGKLLMQIRKDLAQHWA